MFKVDLDPKEALIFKNKLLSEGTWEKADLDSDDGNFSDDGISEGKMDFLGNM